MENDHRELHVLAQGALMKALLVILLSYTSLAWSLTDSHIRMKPNESYMSFFLTSYIDWHQKTFHSRIFGNGKEQDAFLKKVISKIDHWKVKDYPFMDQVLIGETVHHDRTSFSYRFYIHESLRNDSFLSSFHVPGPLFIEWTTEGDLCFITKAADASPVFTYYCRDRKTKKFLKKYTADTLKKEESWRTPYQNLEDKTLSLSDKKGLWKVYYFFRFAHIGRIPEGYHAYINRHGEDILLPFDKFSIDREGVLTIYYP